LDPELTAWIAEVTGGSVVQARLVVTGGRLGYRVDVERGGAPLPLFLQRGRGLSQSSFNPVTREAEVFRALEPLGVSVPHVWGAAAEFDALLVERLDGSVWFHEPPDPAQRLAIAKDFIRQIARWHATPAKDLDLPSFQPVLSAQAHQRAQLNGIRALFEAEDAQVPIDEIARVSLDFLDKAVPAYDGPAVLCQGDTGPGNFIYRDDKVVGVDWELAHFGDPMDDIAWLSWRATQHGFPDFPARMREYEQLSGIEVIPERVYYYRVNACARLGPGFGLADMGREAALRQLRGEHGPAAENDRTADGSQMLMTMLHRRMRLQALGMALGIEPPARDVAAVDQPREHAALYDNILRQLQTMVAMISEPKAASLAKGVARQIKYLKEIDRDGHLFERQELLDIAGLIGRTPGSLAEGRADLAEAARQHRVSFEAYFRYHWSRMIRDDHLMREASGRMYERTWPALA
jgi:aminoglycoside phosphotransferase (APT) family kinase protein